MTSGYLELVGLQAMFDNALARYRLVHYYKREVVEVHQPVMVMRGYDMDRVEDTSAITAGLRKAYAPVILSIWKQGDILTASEYLQFCVGARPDEIPLDGDWDLVTP